MKKLRVLSIIGIVISSIGLIGGMVMLTESDLTGIGTLLLYGYFLAFSIVAMGSDKA